MAYAKLRKVRLREQDSGSLLHPGSDSCGIRVRQAAPEDRRAALGEHALPCLSSSFAVKGTPCRGARGSPAITAASAALRRPKRVVSHGDDGVQFGIERLDAVQMRLHDLEGGERAACGSVSASLVASE